MALDAGKETSVASGVDSQQWPTPQTVEEAIEQVTGSPYPGPTLLRSFE
jgi:hypothetical protein